MKAKDYKDLTVWQKGIEMVGAVYDATDQFLKEERFNLASHIQRTAVSVPSNVAEGFNRQYPKEFRQCCFIALGSCAELETQLIIAARRGYTTAGVLSTLQEAIDHECRMLRNLIKSLGTGRRRTGSPSS
jgi:four helix bundle protein